MPGPLLAVDAPSLMYRAFFALPSNITDDDGPAGQRAARHGEPACCRRSSATSPRAVVLCWGAEAAVYRTEAFAALPRRPPADAATTCRTSGRPRRRSSRPSAGRRCSQRRARGRRPARRARARRGRRGRHGAAVHRRPRHVPVRRRPGRACSSPRARQGRAGARRRRRACAGATGSSRSRCPTSSPCAATRRTGCPGAKGIGEKTARDLLQRARHARGRHRERAAPAPAGGRRPARERGRAAHVQRHRDAPAGRRRAARRPAAGPHRRGGRGARPTGCAGWPRVCGAWEAEPRCRSSTDGRVLPRRSPPSS